MLGMTRTSFKEIVTQTSPGLINQIMRVLKKKGRLYITVPAGGISAVDTVLGLAKVDYREFRPVPESKKNSTADMREHFNLAKTDPGARPYYFVVVKE
jgi:hypothetical protein